MPEQETMERPVADRDPSVRGPMALVLREPDMKWLDIPRDDLRNTLSNSLYPGAKPTSVDMVLAYCEAARLNVMLKPVHIVPMNVKLPNGKYEYRDVVMPGINHYRTQAARTGTYLGKSEPEFGPLVERKFGEFIMNVPEWCKITVKRLVGSHEATFTATEYWDENYATKGKDSTTPNAMWQKRPKGQIAKCTEAQALRMAFPELLSDATAEEMEGKLIDLTAEDVTRVPAAVRSLDQFAGGTANQDEARPDAETSGENVEDAVVEEPVDEAPVMPEEAYDAFIEPAEGVEPDWRPGWQWLVETVEQGHYTQRVKQSLAEVHAALLWAVHDSDAKKGKHGGPQCKAVREFVEKHGMLVPTPVDAKETATDGQAK